LRAERFDRLFWFILRRPQSDQNQPIHGCKNGGREILLNQSKPWVDGYYQTLEEESLPIGAAINPNIVFTSQFMCLKNGESCPRNRQRGA
jgi:hypothetical protein